MQQNRTIVLEEEAIQKLEYLIGSIPIPAQTVGSAIQLSNHINSIFDHLGQNIKPLSEDTSGEKKQEKK
ncbi:hypothetical protein MM236_19205 [Belliella sp. DSM 107340]|uniref:Uncharacterized protein n=1 Tax=Belliella calami TaxID=2923436 RepID=A0ABS9UU27_9BACT|nr:hypothetical protein [Belliella calami]MCH7400132.1 hypothetical protein [Belliella calami]